MIARRLAEGGVDLIKDDHGLADQAYSPFAARIAAVGRAVRAANEASGRRTLYAPHVIGLARRHAASARSHSRRGHHGADADADDRGAVEFPRAECARPRGWWCWRIRRCPARRGSRRRCCSASCSGCSAPTPRCFRIMAAGSPTRRKPAAHWRLRRVRPWGGLKPCLPVPAGGIAIDRVAGAVVILRRRRDAADRRQPARGARAAQRAGGAIRCGGGAAHGQVTTPHGSSKPRRRVRRRRPAAGTASS